MTRFMLILCGLLACAIYAAGPVNAAAQTPDIDIIPIQSGTYDFAYARAPEITVHYYLPAGFKSDTPVLFIIPGARRNADEYLVAWIPLAEAYGFAVLSIECDMKNCPTEYSYNAGGVMNAKGQLQPEDSWLFSVIDPAFEDFKTRFGSTVRSYALYGHSAGGSFVHMFMYFKPDASVSRAVSANGAFFLMPHTDADYPFGLKNVAATRLSMKAWMISDLTIMLGDRDTGPRTKALSNGPEGRAQGPSVYARGLLFYHNALVAAAALDIELNWNLHIVAGVGHSNEKMAPEALPYLFGPAESDVAP